MATHFSILAWRTPMGRGAWWATVHMVAHGIRHNRVIKHSTAQAVPCITPGGPMCIDQVRMTGILGVVLCGTAKP